MNKFDETCQGTVPVALKIISMSTCFEDAIRISISLGADADTLGAIVGSIAESIWGIPLSIRSGIRDYLPEEMEPILMQFYSARPRSFKPLIDTTYAGDDFSDVSWDVLCDLDGKDACEALKLKAHKEKALKRLMMAKRAKAREEW